MNRSVRGRDTILHYNILKILICIVQQNASYPQMYPQKILLPIFALLMAWPLHNIRGDFRQGERAFFEVAPCCHHRNQQPTCRIRSTHPNLGRHSPDVGYQGSHFICYPSCPAGTACHVCPKITRISRGTSVQKKRPARGKVFCKLLKL